MDFLNFIPLYSFFRSTQKKETLIKLAIFTLSSILSMVSTYFSLLSLALLFLYTLCEFSYKSTIWFCLFVVMHPFSPWILIKDAIVFFATILTIKFVLDILNKRVKIKDKLSLSILGLGALAILIVLIPIPPTYFFDDLSLTILFIITISILFINFKDIDIKRLFVMFALFVAVICVVFELFSMFDIVPTRIFYIKKLKRFTLFVSDPNFTGGVLLCAITSILLMFRNNDISNKLFYPLSTTLIVFALHTMSKAFYISFIPLCIFLLIDLIIKYIKTKSSDALIKLVGFCTIIIISFLLSYQYVNITLNRFIKVSESITLDDKVDELTTGRADLWLAYFSQIFSSPVLFLFGHGSYRSILPIGDPHNTVIGLLYNLGALLSIIIASIYILCYLKHYKKFNIFSLMAGLSVFVMYMSITALPSAQFYVFFIIFALCTYNKSELDSVSQDTSTNLSLNN